MADHKYTFLGTETGGTYMCNPVHIKLDHTDGDHDDDDISVMMTSTIARS